MAGNLGSLGDDWSVRGCGCFADASSRLYFIAQTDVGCTFEDVVAPLTLVYSREILTPGR